MSFDQQLITKFFLKDAVNPAVAPLGYKTVFGLSTEDEVNEISAKTGLDVSEVLTAERSQELVSNKPEWLSYNTSLWGRYTAEDLRKLQEFGWKEHYPSVDQGAINDWVTRNTKELIKEFPIPGNVHTVILNALALDVKWTKPYTVDAESPLADKWGINAVLSEDHTTQYKFFSVDGEIFFDHIKVSAQDDGSYLMAHNIVTNDPDNLSKGYEFLFNNGAGQEILPDDVPETEFLKFEVEARTMPNPIVDVKLPAWTTSFGTEFKINDKLSAVQKVFMDYDAEGVKAAAVTAMLRASGMMAPIKSFLVRHFKVEFDRPYLCVLRIDGNDTWSNETLFIARVDKGKNSEIKEREEPQFYNNTGWATV